MRSPWTFVPSSARGRAAPSPAQERRVARALAATGWLGRSSASRRPCRRELGERVASWHLRARFSRTVRSSRRVVRTRCAGLPRPTAAARSSRPTCSRDIVDAARSSRAEQRLRSAKGPTEPRRTARAHASPACSLLRALGERRLASAVASGHPTAKPSAEALLHEPALAVHHARGPQVVARIGVVHRRRPRARLPRARSGRCPARTAARPRRARPHAAARGTRGDRSA